MKITVFGASGKVGRRVVSELLWRGHEVTAFVHGHSLPAQPNLTVISGDVSQAKDVAKALQNADAVISALGSWGTKDKNILSSAMQQIVPAMQKRSLRRIVSLTGNVASPPGERVGLVAQVSKALFNIVAPKILRDGEDHIALLHSSQLNYTVVRASIMTNRKIKSYTLSAKPSGLVVSRRVVARAMADLVESNDWPRQCPFISDGD